MTNDIEIPDLSKIRFPAICVVCEKDGPDRTTEISVLGGSTAKMAEDAGNLAVGDSVQSSATSTEIKGIPVCDNCSPALTRYHRLVKVMTYTSWIPGLGILVFMPVPIWVSAIIAFFVAISPGIYQIVNPPAFGATILNDKTTFEFKSRKCANEFARLNELSIQ